MQHEDYMLALICVRCCIFLLLKSRARHDDHTAVEDDLAALRRTEAALERVTLRA